MTRDRVPPARRHRILRELPPRRCSARSSRRPGEQCRRYALVGSDVCHSHGGGAPQVVAKAAERVLLAEEISRSPRRSPREVLIAAAHTADVLLGRAIAAAGEPLSPDQLDEVVSSVGRAAHLAKITLDAGLDEGTLNQEEVDKIVFVLQVAAGAVGLVTAEADVATAVGQAMRQMIDLGLPGSDRPARLKARIAAVHAATYAKSAERRREIVEELRQQAKTGRCPVCNALPGGPVPAIAAGPEPAQSPVQPSAPVADAPVDVDGSGGPGLSQAAGGAIVEDRLPPVRAVAEVGPRAVARYATCAGCGRLRDPGHEMSCGYVAASARGGWGRG